jgi:hypothetical protein
MKNGSSAKNRGANLSTDAKIYIINYFSARLKKLQWKGKSLANCLGFRLG